MSEEPIKLPEGFGPITPGRVVTHQCEHPGCNKQGGFGFGKPKQASHWFCFGHRSEGERFL